MQCYHNAVLQDNNLKANKLAMKKPLPKHISKHDVMKLALQKLS